MIQLLQVRYRPELEATPDAWFLAGDGPRRWLEELTRSGLARMDTRLYLVPHSIENRSCAGLLVVPSRHDSVCLPPAGIGCRLIAGRLFVPVDAVLHPPITDAEVRELCPLPISFFHPVFGLSGFEEESIVRVSDLIDPPRERDENWNFAQPGVPASPQLSSVALVQPPSIEELFDQAQGDIGTQPPADLPAASGEPKEDSISKTGRALGHFFLKSLADAIQLVPHTSPGRTWVNGLQNWANHNLNRLNERLERLRNKELHRLLDLFETDPEKALRHAIPMSSFPHRGIAPPSARLGSRSLNFDPRRLGGGPADFWNAPLSLQEILRRRYREMADREMQLGRHRRAAYIYAQLLGDLVSAANALRQGRLFREAAILYEEHLNNPLEAARCVAEGGLLPEAIERYERLGLWLEVAGLQEQLGNVAAAKTAIRRVVEDRLAQGDILGAAKLVEERLHEPDEALQMLLQAWPASPQAPNCIAAAFQLLARLGRHEVALERLARFTREGVPDALVLPVLWALGGPTRDYPHEVVRHRAADISRVLIAGQLNRPAMSSAEAGRLLEHLVRLAPRDLLLSRDANRYLADRRNAEIRVTRTTPPPLPGPKPVVDRRFELARQIQWLELRREWHWFYALGVTARRLTLLRGVWDGELQSLSWPFAAEAAKQGFVFEPTADQGASIALVRPGGPPLTQKRFPATYQFFNKVCVAGTPSWLPAQAYPVAFGADAVWTVHVANARAIVSCHDKERGRLQRTIDITGELLDNAERTEDTHLCIAALRNGFAVALGNRLALTTGDGELLKVELPGQAVRLYATIPSTRQGLAVMLKHGAVMYWIGAKECMELDRDLPAPMATFVPGGPLVLVSGLQALLLDVDSRSVKNAVRLQLSCRRAVGVTATAYPGEFGVLDERGEMLVYRIPR
jgi:tetratricopeptide (TPR) repeat protein